MYEVRNKKVPLLVWSGGLDSTALLINLLQQGDVDVLSIEWLGQQNSIDRMEKAIKKIAEAVTNQTYRKRMKLVGHIRHTRTFSVQGYNAGTICKSQIGPILLAASQSCSIDTDSVVLGYILGDTNSTSFSDIQRTFEYLINVSVFHGDQNPLLVAPLIHTTKGGVIGQLPDFIAKHTTWCESLTHRGEDCGVCMSCKRMIVDFTGLLAVTDLDYQKHYPNMMKRLDEMKTRFAKYRNSNVRK